MRIIHRNINTHFFSTDLSCKRGVRIIHRCGLYTGKDGNSNATLKAGPRRHKIFIFRVDSETSEDQIKDFVEGDNRYVVNIEFKSQTDSWTKCYRLVVQCPDLEHLLDPSFWGNGIDVRQYFIKRNRTL